MRKFSNKSLTDGGVDMQYLSAPLKASQANIRSYYKRKDADNGKMITIAEWADEYAELVDARLGDAFKKHCTSHEPKEKFFQDYPMSNEFDNDACRDAYYDLLERVCCSFYDERRWAFGTSKKFDSWIKTQDAMEKGLASAKVLRMVEKYKEKFSTSFRDSKNEIQSIKKKRVFSDDGAELDIDRVMGGDENYWQSRKKNGKARVVRLGIETAMTCGNTEKEFAKVVALGIAIAQEIQKSGYSLEIYKVGKSQVGGQGGEYNWLYNTSVRNNKSDAKIEPTDVKYISRHDGYKVCIKGAQEPIDAQRISCIGLSGVFRGSMFRAQSIALGNFEGRCRGTWSEFDLESFNLDCVVSNRWIDGREEILIQNIKEKLDM